MSHEKKFCRKMPGSMRGKIGDWQKIYNLQLTEERPAECFEIDLVGNPSGIKKTNSECLSKTFKTFISQIAQSFLKYVRNISNLSL